MWSHSKSNSDIIERLIYNSIEVTFVLCLMQGDLFMIFHNSSMTVVDFRFPSITLTYNFERVVEFNYFSAMTEMRQTQCRDSKTAPLTKLTIDLINTYKHINEVRLFITVDLNYDLFSSQSKYLFYFAGPAAAVIRSLQYKVSYI